MIQVTEYIRLHRDKEKDSNLVKKCLNFGGELVFRDLIKTKIETMRNDLMDSQRRLESEIVSILVEVVTKDRSGEDKKALPNLYGSFLSDIDLHLREFKAGSRGWLFKV